MIVESGLANSWSASTALVPIDVPLRQPVGAFRTLGAGTSKDSIFSPDGVFMYTVSGTTVSVFNTSDGAFVRSYSFGNPLGRLDISAGGEDFAASVSSKVSLVRPLIKGPGSKFSSSGHADKVAAIVALRPS